MRVKPTNIDRHLHLTRLAYTWTRILNTPFWALYTLLPLIMSKDLSATAWQIACVISVKPIVSIFSSYWSMRVKQHQSHLVSNIIWANILGHLPFLFVPFTSEPWFFIFANAIYMLFYRGVNPAWMEILKINIPEESRKVVFAYGSAVYHVGGALLAIILGWLMDDYFQAWRWLFPLAVLIAMASLIFQLKIPVKKGAMLAQPSPSPQFSFKEHITKPWKDAWELMQKRPDFMRFQIGFMLGGGGLMLWQPVLPAFFLDTLHLNYKEFTIAAILCKSIGHTLTLPIWTKLMNRVDLFIFSSIVIGLAALFPLGLILSQWNLTWLYIAWLMYGVMQAGSELSWNLSGPIFSRHEDSSTYTGVNVMSIGLRGCIAPFLGGWLGSLTHANVVLLIGGSFCLLASWQLYAHRQQRQSYFISSTM